MSHQWYILRSNWNYRMKIALGAIGDGPGFWLKSWVEVPGTQPRAGWGGKGPVWLSKRCWVSLHWGLGHVAWVTLDQGSSKMTSCCAVSVSSAVLRAQECHLCQVSTDGWAQAPSRMSPQWRLLWGSHHCVPIPQTGQRVAPEQQWVNQLLFRFTGGQFRTEAKSFKYTIFKWANPSR